MIWTLIVFRLSLDGQCSLTIADFFIVVFLQPCWFSFTFISYFYLCRCQDICWTASRPQGRSKERLQLTASQRPDFLPTSWSGQIWTLHFASKEICQKPFSQKCWSLMLLAVFLVPTPDLRPVLFPRCCARTEALRPHRLEQLLRLQPNRPRYLTTTVQRNDAQTPRSVSTKLRTAITHFSTLKHFTFSCIVRLVLQHLTVKSH